MKDTLFFCIASWARSRIAKGFFRSIARDRLELSNAGRACRLLLAFLLGSGLAVFSAAWAAHRHVSETASSTRPVQGKPSQTPAPVRKIGALSELPEGVVSHVDVIYFHRKDRCTTCLNVERYTRETIEKYFAEPAKRGLISLRVLDAEKVENAPLLEKFDAVGSSLHLAVLVGGTEYLCTVQDAWFYATNKYLFVEKLKEKLASLVGGS